MEFTEDSDEPEDPWADWGEDSDGGWWLGFGGGAVERLSLALSEEQMLVATVFCRGGASLRVPDLPRTLHLCAARESDVADEDAAVRSADGELISSTGYGADAVRPDDGLLPPPHLWGQETHAMASGHQLIEWLVVTSCEFTANGFHGDTESDGPFAAELHPDHNFVLAVSLGEGEQRHTVLEMTSYQVAPREEALLRPGDIDPAVLDAYLA